MVRKIEDFLKEWDSETKSTLRIFQSLTAASLSQKVTPDGRSIGQIAWHLTLTLKEMLGHAGLVIPGPGEDAPTPADPKQIYDLYNQGASALAGQVQKGWKDEMLADEIPMYGETWRRGDVLSAFINHLAHHRGQMTILMRQAGLKVPGIYGPAREEWATWNMPAPW